MEEDIKDLKKYISFANKSENFPHDTDWKWHKEVATKIQNLIAKNKELEKENIINKTAKEEVEELLENSIPISKIQDKIEDLIKEKQKHGGLMMFCTTEVIKILQELLEE